MPKPASKGVGTTLAQYAFFGLVSAVLLWVLLEELGLLDLFLSYRRPVWLPAAVAGAGAVIGVTRLSRVLHALTGAAVALWLVVCLTPIAGHMAQSLKVEAPPAPADAVVVLASSVQPDDDFTSLSLARLTLGVELVQGKFAPRLVLTEIGRPWGSYTRAAQDLLAHLGLSIPIQTLGVVRNTYDEALAVSRLAREKGWKRILLVTSPTHSRRALATFQKAGLDAIPEPCRETRYDLEDPVLPQDRLNAFADAIHEIVGLRVYRLRGWAE